VRESRSGPVRDLLHIQTTVNGRQVTIEVEPRLKLAEFLRSRLGLTGTKISCEMQVCGACTVLLDGRPVSACTTLTAEIDGRIVLTIEGLGSTSEGLDPIQQAFARHSAFQCGFCTSGMIMTLKAALDQAKSKSSSELIECLDGNICRCGTYGAILEVIDELVRNESVDQRAQ
jgi:carbon-monoxide dehydrogenase small subunit/glyceraldehyde dehydrogenase small subunit